YNTPNIHLCTLDDFERLAPDLGLRLLERATFHEGREITLLPGWRSTLAVYRYAADWRPRDAPGGPCTARGGCGHWLICRVRRASRRLSLQEPSISAASHVYFSRRVAPLLVLGFASGLPLALTGGTLQAWATVDGVSLEEIGFLTLVG